MMTQYQFTLDGRIALYRAGWDGRAPVSILVRVPCGTKPVTIYPEMTAYGVIRA